MDFSASEPSGIYWFLGSRDMGHGVTGARLLHTVTQGTRTSLPCGSTMSPRGLLTRHIQLATSTDQRRAGHTDRRCQGGPGEPLPAGPTSGQTWTSRRESQTCRTARTRCVSERGTAGLPSCPYPCVAKPHPCSPGRLSRENKINVIPTNVALQRPLRKHCLLISKESLLAIQTHFFLPFLLLKEREHIVLEPPTWSWSMASRPLPLH